MYIDTHTHVNLSAFTDDFDTVILRALENDVWMVNVGTQIRTSTRAVELVSLYPKGVYATVGLHPVHTSPSFHDEDEVGEEGKAFSSKGERFDYEVFKVLAEDPKVLAIGECGLDYYRGPTDEERTKQIEAFEAQIALANELSKPLMLHLRSGKGGNAYKDAYEILKRQAKVRGNAHFFAGSLEDAHLFWGMGYSTSFTGVLTFTHDYDEVVGSAPKELIHAETDAPYVAPKPYRGTRNEPLYVREVVARMAEIRGVEVEEWKGQLWENAIGMYGINNVH
jgi:TatD DNase family protein